MDPNTDTTANMIEDLKIRTVSMQSKLGEGLWLGIVPDLLRGSVDHENFRWSITYMPREKVHAQE